MYRCVVVEILMAGEFLNRPRRRAPHRQVRTERVPERCARRCCAVRAPRRPSDVVLDDLLRQRRSVVVDTAPAVRADADAREAPPPAASSAARSAAARPSAP